MNEISTDDSPLMNGFWTKFNLQRKLNEIERYLYESLRFLNNSFRTDKRIVNGYQRIINEIERNLNEFDQNWNANYTKLDTPCTAGARSAIWRVIHLQNVRWRVSKKMRTRMMSKMCTVKLFSLFEQNVQKSPKNLVQNRVPESSYTNS